MCISSSKGHRRSSFGFVMDRSKRWQRVAAKRDCDEHDQWLGDDPPFGLKVQNELCYKWDNLAQPTLEHWIALAFDLGFNNVKDQSVDGYTRGRRNGDGVAMQIPCGLGSSGFRSYHRFPSAKGFHGIRNPSKTVSHWFIPAYDGKISESSTLVGKKLAADCLEESGKGLRPNESLSFGNSTSVGASFWMLQVGSYQHVEYIMVYKDFDGLIDEGSILCFENAVKRKHCLERIEDAHNEVKAMQENPEGSTSSSVVPSTDDKKADDLDMDHARAT
ncbi:hypothetical protein V6N13_071064 [Hibiscus sabdariffa]|uniref:Uncharacterized protein n=1 Tax=Hibiscus sabdariffa TaxID=183260 RepID=A0ABR2TF95_9ROSI